ncbi:kinase-like protein [Gonapodya prolifera JEL478]|uniref:Kinase-like protein n=1 Tax=Gonapodya prolifera (strain JEL478) TaxID=1344416 RepID=A0A139APU9_GONPJ|nr:kinase-like protein [Gonapodya prolifera JEL478]|eukprot:KXS18752.1 kinase-like protein [Gonapodya prolifera JEL478]
MASVDVESPESAIPLDLRQLSFFDKRSQVMYAQRTSKLLSQDTREDLRAKANAVSGPKFAQGPELGQTYVRPDGTKVMRAIFQEWSLGKTLGQGAFASVGEATTSIASCGRDVRAVFKSSKVVPYSEWDANDENRHQFLYVIRELTTLVHLSRSHPTFPGLEAACHVKYGHPSIVKIYDGVFDTENRMFHTFMERANGIELFDFLRERGGKLPEPEVKIIMKQLLRALDYMHTNRVIHRDIKLDNIIIDPKTLRIMLIDFNLAAFYHPTVRLHEPVGCINYSSPQILETAIFPDRGGYLAERGWSDLWASGVVMYGMLVGFFPFRSQTPRKLYNEILRLEKRPLEWVDSEHVGPAARRFAEKMLDPRSVGRLTAGELLEDPYLAGVPAFEDTWYPTAHNPRVLAATPVESAFAPPAKLPVELRRFWTINKDGVSPEMTSDDLDVQFFAIRRAMFGMLGIEPPQCVLEQERMVAGLVQEEDVDMDDSMTLESSRSSKEWSKPDIAVGPGMPGRDVVMKEPSASTVVSPNRAASHGSDRTAVRVGEEGDSATNTTSVSSGTTAVPSLPENVEHLGKVHMWKLSHKSKVNIAKMVQTGFKRVRDAVQDWKKCGGKGMVGVSGELQVLDAE